MSHFHAPLHKNWASHLPRPRLLILLHSVSAPSANRNRNLGVFLYYSSLFPHSAQSIIMWTANSPSKHYLIALLHHPVSGFILSEQSPWNLLKRQPAPTAPWAPICTWPVAGLSQTQSHVGWNSLKGSLCLKINFKSLAKQMCLWSSVSLPLQSHILPLTNLPVSLEVSLAINQQILLNKKSSPRHICLLAVLFCPVS